MCNKVPEISRISPFYGADMVQIFGENLDINTKLYVWLNKGETDKKSADLTAIENAGGVDAALAFKMELAKNNTTPIVEENANGKIATLLPAVPPEDALVYDADDCVDKVIYFGEKPGPQPVDGKYLRPDDSTSVMWLKNDAGFSAPYIVNRPEIWKISDTTTYPGGHISIYGPNFGRPAGFSDGTHFAKISMLRNRETGEFIKTTAVEETAYWHNVQRYTADFIVPEGTPDGEYDVFIHSGKCGIFGWSEPVKLTVKSELSLIEYYRTKWNRMAGSNPARPKCEIINIASSNSPVADYADTLQQAIDKLHAVGGGILALGAGTYPISKTVYVKPGVVLLGSGNATVIKAAEDTLFFTDWSTVKFAVRPDKARGWSNDWFEHYLRHRQATLLVLEGNCGTDSIRLELGDGANMGIVVANGETDRADNVFVNKTEIDARCLSELEYDGLYGAICAALVVGARTENFVAWSSKFISTYCVQILPARHENMVLVNNEINCHPRQIGESHISGIRHSIVANNLFIGGRRAFTGQGGLSYNWIYQNRVVDTARAPGAEENYMSEHGGGEWNGKPIAWGSNYITVKEDSIENIFTHGKGDDVQKILDCYNRYMFVLCGRGFGQYFRVIDTVKVEEGKYNIIFDKDFSVLPDSTTSFAMMFGTHHNLWIDNNTTMSNGHTQFVWNCGFENFIVGHQMEMAAGVYMHSLLSKNHAQRGSYNYLKCVVAFNTFIACQTRSSGVGLKFTLESNKEHFDGVEGAEDYNYTAGTFGNAVVGCVFDGAVGQMYVKNSPNWDQEQYPVGIQIAGAYNRVAGNKVRGYDTAYAVLGHHVGNCFARNYEIGESKKFMGTGTPIGFDAK